MRKRALTRTKTLGSVSLYRGDLEQLADLFHSNAITQRIADSENEYDDLADLEGERGEVVHDLLITGLGSECEVKLQITRQGGTTLEVVNNDPIFFSIIDFLKRRRRNILYYGLVLGTLASIGLYFLFGKTAHRSLAITSLLIFAPTFMSLILCFVGTFSQVYLTRKHQTSSFWRRNKDTVLVALIGAIIGAFLTWLVTYLTK